MKCNQASDCYFFQECVTYPQINSCHGYCEFTYWFNECIFGTIVLVLGILVACFRCECCPLYRFLVRRGNLPVSKVPAGMTDLSEKRSRNISTFEEVVLVRSLSEKWLFMRDIVVQQIMQLMTTIMIGSVATIWVPICYCITLWCGSLLKWQAKWMLIAQGKTSSFYWTQNLNQIVMNVKILHNFLRRLGQNVGILSWCWINHLLTKTTVLFEANGTKAKYETET